MGSLDKYTHTHAHTRARTHTESQWLPAIDQFLGLIGLALYATTAWFLFKNFKKENIIRKVRIF